MPVEEKWVAVRTGGYRKTDRERDIHRQDKGTRLFANLWSLPLLSITDNFYLCDQFNYL